MWICDAHASIVLGNALRGLILSVMCTSRGQFENQRRELLSVRPYLCLARAIKRIDSLALFLR